MPQKGRKVPPLDPGQIRRAHVVTQPPSHAAWDAAEAHGTLDSHVIAAGVMQSSATQLWHTWVSLYGADLTSWYVGPNGATASAILLAIKELFSCWQGDQEDLSSMEALLAVASEYSTDPRATLPDQQVKDILTKIATYQLRKN